MDIGTFYHLHDRLEIMAIKAGFTPEQAVDLAAYSIENAQNVDGFEISIECAVATMDLYIDEFDATIAMLTELPY